MKNILSRQKGVGLIEVMVAVLLLATGLLVMASLQVRSLQFNHSAYLRSQANILAYDIIDRMRLNAVNVNSYAIEYTGTPSGGSSLAEVDIKQWRDNLTSTMPNGKGSIKCVSRVCTIGIEWDEVNSSGESTEDKTTFTFSTQI